MSSNLSARGRGNEELLFSGYRVSVWDDESILEIHSGDHYTTVRMYLMPLYCYLNLIKKLTFTLSVFTTIKK